MKKITSHVVFLDDNDLNLTTRKLLKENDNYKVTQDDVINIRIIEENEIVIYDKIVLKSRW